MFGFGGTSQHFEPNVREVPLTKQIEDPNIDDLLSAPSLILWLSRLQIEFDEFPINLWMRMRDISNAIKGIEDEGLSGQWHFKL